MISSDSLLTQTTLFMKLFPAVQKKAIAQQLSEQLQARENFVENFDGIRRCRILAVPGSSRRRNRTSR